MFFYKNLTKNTKQYKKLKFCPTYYHEEICFAVLDFHVE